VEGQFLCAAENWVNFLILHEGTWRLVLSHGRIKFRSWKNMNNKKEIIKLPPVTVQCVTAAAECNSMTVRDMRET